MTIEGNAKPKVKMKRRVFALSFFDVSEMMQHISRVGREHATRNT